MSNPSSKNISASVFAKLKNIAKKNSWNFNLILVRYATERFLYRLSISEYANQFVLKGGNLFIIWQNGMSFRPTVDSDFLFVGNASDEHLKSVFVDVCQTTDYLEDGILFDSESIRISLIRDDTEYGGTRVILNAFLGNARIPLQIDIGVGDKITPGPETAEFPVLLDGKIPTLKVYPMTTVIAEKAETMVSRGLNNSRMKDFYDIWLLSELFDHDFVMLKQAITNTFNRREVALPSEIPECFSEEFMDNRMKNTQWNAFCRKNKLEKVPNNFKFAIMHIKEFLMPVLMPSGYSLIKWTKTKGWE